ncbi:hypothetical protein [Streptomyces sp. NPDC054874]
MDLTIAKAVERQTVAVRELSRRAFLKPVVVMDDALARSSKRAFSAPPGRGRRGLAAR